MNISIPIFLQEYYSINFYNTIEYASLSSHYGRCRELNQVPTVQVRNRYDTGARAMGGFTENHT